MLKLNEDLEALKNQKEKIASDLLDAESLSKKLKKENLLLKNSSSLLSGTDQVERINPNYPDEAEKLDSEQLKDNKVISSNSSSDIKVLEKKENLEEERIEKPKAENNGDEDSTENNGCDSKANNAKLQRLAALFIQTPKVFKLISIKHSHK